MSIATRRSPVDVPGVLLWLATFLGAIVTTHLLRDAQFPLGWSYLALFLLAGSASSLGRGIYRWTAAAWGGALLILVVGSLRQEGYLTAPLQLLAAQYLPAALTGALLGEWLRYQLSRLRGLPFAPAPSFHVLVAAALLLLVLPLITFGYAASHTLATPHLLALLMFTPGNTPFLFPSLLTAALCGYWVRSAQATAPAPDRRAALLVMVLSLLLMAAALLAKVIFGIIEVA